MRNALIALGQRRELDECRTMVEHARTDGLVWVGMGDLEKIEDAAMVLADSGYWDPAVDAEPDELMERVTVPTDETTEPVKLPPGDASFTPAAYETAMLLLVQFEGQALMAAAGAHHLARVTQSDSAVYGEAILALAYVFPWIADDLRNNNMLPE